MLSTHVLNELPIMSQKRIHCGFTNHDLNKANSAECDFIGPFAQSVIPCLFDDSAHILHECECTSSRAKVTLLSLVSIDKLYTLKPEK